MKVYICLYFHHNAFQQVAGVYDSLAAAEKIKKDNENESLKIEIHECELERGIFIKRPVFKNG